MIAFRLTLSSIVCVVLPFSGIGMANATDGGDAVKPFQDATNNTEVKRGAMTLDNGSAEKNLTESPSLSLTPPPPGSICNLSTRQVMDLDSKNYRWHNEDVNDTFIDPNFNATTLQSATLCIKYQDVDFTSASAYTPELNVVQLGNTTLDILPGNDGETLTKCWNVKSRLQKNTSASIPFIINVDAAHSSPYWAVYLHSAVLSTCHVSPVIPPPWPPVVIPPYRY